MEINYSKYLDGDEWPSESLAATVDPVTGEYEPALEPVIDMVPQKAVAALHKLIRWAREQEISVIGEERAENEVRNSTLGRLLARKALRIEDFDLYSEHGVDTQPLDTKSSAIVLVNSLLNVADLDHPQAAGRLAAEVARDLEASGYKIIKES